MAEEQKPQAQAPAPKPAAPAPAPKVAEIPATPAKVETKFETGLPKPISDAMPHHGPVVELAKPEFHIDQYGQWEPGPAPAPKKE
jgi:hypothetical protein